MSNQYVSIRIIYADNSFTAYSDCQCMLYTVECTVHINAHHRLYASSVLVTAGHCTSYVVSQYRYVGMNTQFVKSLNTISLMQYIYIVK